MILFYIILFQFNKKSKFFMLFKFRKIILMKSIYLTSNTV